MVLGVYTLVSNVARSAQYNHTCLHIVTGCCTHLQHLYDSVVDRITCFLWMLLLKNLASQHISVCSCLKITLLLEFDILVKVSSLPYTLLEGDIFKKVCWRYVKCVAEAYRSLWKSQACYTCFPFIFYHYDHLKHSKKIMCVLQSAVTTFTKKQSSPKQEMETKRQLSAQICCYECEEHKSPAAIQY
jgi:hypothetical protein